MAHADPREDGFNYGAPLPEPLWDAAYQSAKLLAEVLRKRNSGAARQRSWDFDMRVRAVRVSCSQAEQDKTLAQLKNVLGLYFRHVTAYRHALLWAKANELAYRATFAR